MNALSTVSSLLTNFYAASVLLVHTLICVNKCSRFLVIRGQTSMLLHKTRIFPQSVTRLSRTNLNGCTDRKNDPMTASEHFRNMLAMASADGMMSEAELRLLSHRAAEFGITDNEFEDAIQKAIANEVQISVPEDWAERSAILKDMVRMMAADGELKETEKKLFAVVATMYEFDGAQLNQLMDEVVGDG